MSERLFANALVASVVALCAVACGRRSGVFTTSGSAVPLPASEFADEASVDAARSDAGPPRPVGRKPVPVLYDGEWVSALYGRAAPPSLDHPKGTIAALRTNFVPDPTYIGAGGVGTDDVSIVEVDLATATAVRSSLLARGTDGCLMTEGIHGLIVELQLRDELTLAWLDESLAVRVRRSWPKLGSHTVEFCSLRAVGDRAELSTCRDRSGRSRFWLMDDQGRTVAHYSAPAPGLDSPRLPEVIEAESLEGYASELHARLIEGLIVLQALHCCGEYGPSLLIYDPHADFE